MKCHVNTWWLWHTEQKRVCFFFWPILLQLKKKIILLIILIFWKKDKYDVTVIDCKLSWWLGFSFHGYGKTEVFPLGTLTSKYLRVLTLCADSLCCWCASEYASDRASRFPVSWPGAGFPLTWSQLVFDRITTYQLSSKPGAECLHSQFDSPSPFPMLGIQNLHTFRFTSSMKDNA